MNRILLPRMKHCSRLETRPSRPVSVTLLSCMFMLSSLSTRWPRYTSPVLISTVIVWPSASCSSLTYARVRGSLSLAGELDASIGGGTGIATGIIAGALDGHSRGVGLFLAGPQLRV